MLNKARQNELNLNEAYVKSSVGQPVTFGQTVQLLHKQPGLYLSMNEQKKASMQKENVTCELQNGSPDSWFTLIPRYNRDQKGDYIFSQDHVLLQSRQDQKRKANKLFLHCASLSHQRVSKTIWGKMQRTIEVNCSMSFSGWQLIRYRQVKASKKLELQIGDCIRFSHSTGEGEKEREGEKSYLVLRQPKLLQPTGGYLNPTGTTRATSSTLGSWEIGERVRVVKEGSQQGKKAVIKQCEWITSITFGPLLTILLYSELGCRKDQSADGGFKRGEKLRRQ